MQDGLATRLDDVDEVEDDSPLAAQVQVHVPQADVEVDDAGSVTRLDSARRRRAGAVTPSTPRVSRLHSSGGRGVRARPGFPPPPRDEDTEPHGDRAPVLS